MNGAALERAAEMDAAFFQAHPRRTARIRETIEGEWPGIFMPAFTLVWRIAPGVRGRAGLISDRRPIDTEASALAMLALLAPGAAGWA
jgi:hypothetical protein